MFFEWLGAAWDSLLLDETNGQVFLTLCFNDDLATMGGLANEFSVGFRGLVVF